jgi:hypothetical protein
MRRRGKLNDFGEVDPIEVDRKVMSMICSSKMEEDALL